VLLNDVYASAVAGDTPVVITDYATAELVKLAANAAVDPYVPNSSITVSGPTSAGSTPVVNFAAGSFSAGEQVAFTVTGQGPISLSVVKAAVETARLTELANATTGAVLLNVKLPANASGTYTVTATGRTSARVGTAFLTVAAVDAGSGKALAFTGANVSPLITWGAGGVVLLGLALLVVMGIVRRERASE
jgi:hypothetical protein